MALRARATPCGGSLVPSLAKLALGPAPKGPRLSTDDLTDEQYRVWLDSCVELHDLLKKNNVPKNPDCGQDPATVGVKRSRAPRVVECSDDGYIMRVDLRDVYALGSELLAPVVSAFVGPLANVVARTISTVHSQWIKFEPGASTEDRLKALQTCEALRQQDWCVYRNSRIPFNVFDEDGKPLGVEDVPIDSFTHELLAKTSHFYNSKDGKTIAFATYIDSSDAAEKSGVPWKDDKSVPYLYVDLICSRAPGGGLSVMAAVAVLAVSMWVPYVYMSALSHVVFLYARKANAKFINRDTDEVVDVSDEWVTHEPTFRPLSKAQARSEGRAAKKARSAR
jgi:hypothetical protein